MRRSRTANGDKDRSRRGAGKQELEPPDLVASGRVLAFEPERAQSQRARERRVRLGWRGALGEAARGEGGAYFLRPSPGGTPGRWPPIQSPQRARRPEGRAAAPAGGRPGAANATAQ